MKKAIKEIECCNPDPYKKLQRNRIKIMIDLITENVSCSFYGHYMGKFCEDFIQNRALEFPCIKKITYQFKQRKVQRKNKSLEIWKSGNLEWYNKNTAAFLLQNSKKHETNLGFHVKIIYWIGLEIIRKKDHVHAKMEMFWLIPLSLVLLVPPIIPRSISPN